MDLGGLQPLDPAAEISLTLQPDFGFMAVGLVGQKQVSLMARRRIGPPVADGHPLPKSSRASRPYCDIRMFSSRLNWMRTLPSESIVDDCR